MGRDKFNIIDAATGQVIGTYEAKHESEALDMHAQSMAYPSFMQALRDIPALERVVARIAL